MLMNNDLIPRLQLARLSAALQHSGVNGFEPLEEGANIPTFSSTEDAFRSLNCALRPKVFPIDASGKNDFFEIFS